MVRHIASAPLRADLAGGTIDLWPLYLLHDRAATVNFALNLRATVSYQAGGPSWKLVARDLAAQHSVPPHSLEAEAARSGPGEPFALVLRALAALGAPKAGPGTLETMVEGPPGGGLSGSSALLVACIALLRRLRRRPVDRASLPFLARDLEAQVLGVPTGIQDYYPALYGGVQLLRYGPGGIQRHSLRVDPLEIERRVVIAYSGRAHESGLSNWSLYRRRVEGDPRAIDAFERIGRAGERIGAALEQGRWRMVSRMVEEDWTARIELEPKLAPPELIRLAEAGRASGATAARGCGAASGGCMLFIVDPRRKKNVEAALRDVDAGCVISSRVARTGLRIRRGAPPMLRR